MTRNNFLLSINDKINRYANKFSHPYFTFAIFGIITYPIYYFLWVSSGSIGYDNFPLRLVTVVLCVTLSLKNYWPENLKKFLAIYWYFTLLYSLPFLFTFFLLKNDFSFQASMNTLTVLVLMILLLDIISLSIILFLGVLSGIVVFSLGGDVFNLPDYYPALLISYGSILFFGTMFSYSKDQLKEAEKKIKIAEESNKIKSEFIANMSHDIRTPLTGVIGLSEVLEQTLQDAQDREKAHMLHDSGEELLYMLNEILDDVRAGNLREIDVKTESFDVHQCIHDLIRLESPATTLKQLELQANIASDVPRYIESDRNKIHRILLNLTSNAIKFTQSGCISLSIDCLHRDSDKVLLRFSVSDTGIGISKDVQAQVFNRFFKVSSSYKGTYSGHGLGLHIAQTYVKLLGGHITLSSKEGVGSTFHFDLECSLGKAPEKITVHPDPQIPPSATIKTPHILIVEDNLVASKSLELLLAQKNYSFVSTATGEEAWTLLNNHTFDLMITDIGLPGISGTELTKRVRAQEKKQDRPHLLILGLTGHAKETALAECTESGMDEVLCKPAQIDVIHSCIQQLMQKIVNNKKEEPLAKFTKAHDFMRC